MGFATPGPVWMGYTTREWIRIDPPMFIYGEFICFKSGEAAIRPVRLNSSGKVGLPAGTQDSYIPDATTFEVTGCASS